MKETEINTHKNKSTRPPPKQIRSRSWVRSPDIDPDSDIDPDGFQNLMRTSLIVQNTSLIKFP